MQIYNKLPSTTWLINYAKKKSKRIFCVKFSCLWLETNQISIMKKGKEVVMGKNKFQSFIHQSTTLNNEL